MKQVELSASQEDYLETIYFLSLETGFVRPKEIAEKMNVRAATVTGSLRILTEKKLINYEPYSAVSLTPLGLGIAEKVATKHRALLNFFTKVLGVPEADSEEFACKMEHFIPDHILQRFVGFAEYTEKCPSFNASWQDNAEGYFCKIQGKESLSCSTCHLGKGAK